MKKSIILPVFFIIITVTLNSCIYENHSLEEKQIVKSFNLTTSLNNKEFEVGDTVTLEWETTGKIDDIRIEYKTGFAWKQIATKLKNTNCFNWVIPNDISDSVCVKLMDSENEETYVIDGFFKISERRSIFITKPTVTDTLNVNDTTIIKWNTTGEIESVKIEYDNGRGWILISSKTPNDGIYNWYVPDDSSGIIKIKISDISNEINATILSYIKMESFYCGFQPTEIGDEWVYTVDSSYTVNDCPDGWMHSTCYYSGNKRFTQTITIEEKEILDDTSKITFKIQNHLPYSDTSIISFEIILFINGVNFRSLSA